MAYGTIRWQEDAFCASGEKMRGFKMKLKKIAISIAASALALSMLCTAAMATSFTDVPASHWAYGSIEKAASNNWVSGTGNGKFEPDGAMTGAQWLTMVVRVFYGDEVLGGNSVTWYIPYVTVADAHKLRENADNRSSEGKGESTDS